MATTENGDHIDQATRNAFRFTARQHAASAMRRSRNQMMGPWGVMPPMAWGGVRRETRVARKEPRPSPRHGHGLASPPDRAAD